ncbi:hypothetical protein GCM10023213_25840 [Prosthecobacter algae]|uniref:Uncharacterized protein n=1 Tax=Prosthecobacter algae TaxID=1144682 RepID=A0ABP9P6V9_9BACT
MNFHTDLGVNSTINLDGNRTIGKMVLGDLFNNSNTYTFASGTGGSLTFNNRGDGGGAFVNKITGITDSITAPVTLNDQLNIRATISRLTLSNTITGNGNTITSYGNGTLSLTGNNTGSNFDLVLWNRGTTNTGAQVELGASSGRAVGGNITIGNASRGTSGHAVLQLLAGRSNDDQILDTATLTFDSFAGSGRNNYFKLMGVNETVGRLLDLGSLAVIENRESEGIFTASRLTIAGNADSYVTGFIRDNSGNNFQQADADGTAGTRGLGITKEGAGTLTLQGGNMIFTGGLTVTGGTTILRQATNFRSDVVNNGTLIFDNTGTWGFTKTFDDPDGSGPVRAPVPQNLTISGSGNVEKMGNGILNLGGSASENHLIGGSFTVRNGTLNFMGAGATDGGKIGGSLVVAGDSGLNRNVSLLGRTTIVGGIDATGRYANTGSTISVRGTVLTGGDKETSFFQDGLATINGDVKLRYMDLRLESDFAIAKTSGPTSSGSTVTITNSSSIVVGMRVTGSGIQADTVVTAIDPVDRVVTLSKSANIPAGSGLNFAYSSHTDGVINGTLPNLTIVGRPATVGATPVAGGLYLVNNRYSNNTNRLPDGTNINLKGGVIEFINDGTTNTFSEQLGALTLNQGQSQINAYQAGAGGTSALRFSSLARNYGSTVEFSGRELVGTVTSTVTNTLGTNTRNQILINGGVTLDNGIIGGWAWANNEFVKYGANGVTRLLETDYAVTLAATDQANQWFFDRNVKMTGASNFTTLTLSARRAINSLNIQATTADGAAAANRAVTLGTNILSIESGGLLANHGSHTITGSGSTGYLTVGSPIGTPAELFVTTGTTANSTTASALTLNTAVRDFILEFRGQGAPDVVTMPADSFTMTVPINTATVLQVGMEVTHANLPPGTVITAVDRTQAGVTTITLNKKPTAALAASNANPVAFKGGSVGLVKSGPGTLVMPLTFQNTYTGPTVVNNGILRLRANTNLGTDPSTFQAAHLQINGGTLQFGRDSIAGTAGVRSPDFNDYMITDGNRGITFGDAGGRLEIGHINPSPRLETAGNITQVVNVTITNPIYATGVVELAVRSNVGISEFNSLVLGDEDSENYYGGGIKTEGTYDGKALIYGNNYVNGLFMEGGRVEFFGNNNFSSDIRILSGQLTLYGNNTYNNTSAFTDTITINSATVNLLSESALGTAGIKVNMTDNAQLRFQGTNQTLLSLAGTASSTISNGHSRPTGTGTEQDNPSTLTVQLPINETYNGRLNNGGSSKLNLVKTGPGRLALTSNDSDFTGDVSILEGVIDVTTITFAGGQSALGKGSRGNASEIFIDGGALSFSPRGQQFTNRSFSMGAGIDAATLVANGLNQAARVILGSAFTLYPGTQFEESYLSQPVGLVGAGSRTLTLSGVNTGDNEFQLQLSDKSATEATSLLKAGPGTWALGTAANFSGAVTQQEGVLAVLGNDTLGTSNGIPTTVGLDPANTLTGDIPNGTEVTFPKFYETILPVGLQANRRYYVIASNGTTFQVATSPGSTTAVKLTALKTFNEDFEEIPIYPANVVFVPNIQSVASTVGLDASDTFSGNLINGTAVVFSYGLPNRATITNAQTGATLPGGITTYETYYVVNATGTTFKVAPTPGGTALNLTSNSTGNIIYTASGPGISTSGVNIIGGRLELRNVDYMTHETLTFQGGALSVPAKTTATWAGNLDVQANTTFTVGANSELVLNGNVIGTRSLTQLGEGIIRMRGETITPTQPDASLAELDSNRRTYSVQAGTLILDYGINNNSKLVDVATLVLGGGRRGGILRLQGGSHEEVVNNLSIQPGANQIYRDSGTSTIRLNTISRAEGSSLYFDLARIATVDNLNINNILGGWAIIRDAVVNASWTLRGTVSRNFTANVSTDLLTPTPVGVHYLANGSPVRLTTTGSLPSPLLPNKTYYVVSASAIRFKLSETPAGPPIDILTTGGAGGDVHTVASYQPQRAGPSTLVFMANPDIYPGALGNDIFRVEIDNSGVAGNITSQLTVPPEITPATPLIYRIITTTTKSSANDIVAFVNGTDIVVRNYLSVTSSGSDLILDPGDYGPQLLQGGTNDNGSQELGWARNGSNSLDGLVQVNSVYSANSWQENANTNMVSNTDVQEGSSTYTLRFASSAPIAVTLGGGNEFGGISTLQTGAILVSPTVGANDSSIIGSGSLATLNEGNLRDFMIHQYNEQGDLVIGVPLLNRDPVVRRGRLTSGNRRIISGLTTTAGLEVGATVAGPGIPGSTVIAAILDSNTVRLNNEGPNSDTRVELTFTVAGNQIKRFGTTQSSTTQNRINGVVNPITGALSTSDIYINMPISGPGIPAGALVGSIVNESDITLNTNHFFNAEPEGIVSEFTLTPSVGVQKLGGGTLILSGNNTYNGVTFIADGVLRAQNLTDGGIAGSLGASTNTAANLVFNGGTLQYIGENNSNNRNFTITDFARIDIGHEKTTSIFNGSISLSGTIGASDRLEKTGSGTLEMRGGGSLNEIKVDEGKLRVQLVDLNPAPGSGNISNLGQNGLASLRLAGGIFEVRGAAETNSGQTFGGSLFVDEGASKVIATSVSGFDPNNLRIGAQARTTTLTLMGGEETTRVLRASGGTVHFVENPETNSGAANIILNTNLFDRAQILPWAVYQNTADTGTPGVNNFASISLTSAGVVSADSLFLHDLGSFFMNANNWGTVEPGTAVDASEGGTLQVNFTSGITATTGSKVLLVSPVQTVNFNRLLVGMSVFGLGIPADTQIESLDPITFTITLTKESTGDFSDTAYLFEQKRTFFGRVGLVDPNKPEDDSVNVEFGRDRELNTLRYYSDADSTITIDEDSTMRLTSGAILVASNVRGGSKNIVGPGNITGVAAAGDSSDFIVHNYNPSSDFTIGANIVDNVLRLELPRAGLPALGAGSIEAGQTTLNSNGRAFQIFNRIHPGMEVTGPGLQTDTFVVATVTLLNQIVLSKPALTTHIDATYIFRSTTNFVQSGTGTTVLSGTNIYTGNTFVHGGVLRLDSATALPGGISTSAPLATSSHIIVKDGVIGLGSGDFTRNLGTAANQIEFKGSGGFAAYGSNRLVNFGGAGARLRFGNDGFVTDGSSLILGASDATHKVTIVNPIDLGSFSQVVRVNNGPADIEGELSGTLSGVGKLIKFGQGTLRLSGQSTHTGGIEISDGRLVVANVPNVLGLGAGAVSLGTSNTNTSKNAAIELAVEGGNVSKNINVGNVNSRGPNWLARGTVDTSASDLGTHSSMALVNGNPAIAYYDASTQDLKYVRAADARGNTWLPPVTLASRGDVGKYPSLSVINGTPAVSYYDATNGTLCYIRSTDSSGVFWAASVIADSSPVSAIGIQSDGKIVVGGTFTEFDGVAQTRLARFSSTGVLDTGFNVTVSGEVRAIVIQSDDSIIIAGAFTKVKGSGAGQTETDRNNIARLSSSGALDAGYNPNADNTVRTLLLQPDGSLLVGGVFSNIGGSGRNRLARLTSAGIADAFNPNVDGEIFALALEADGSVLLGGSFLNVSGQSRNRLARVNSAGVLQAFNPNANNVVRGIVVAGDGNIYVGGLFSTLVGTGSGTTFTRNRLARLLPDGKVDFTYGVEVNAEIRSMRLLASGKIAVLGIFSGVGQTSVNFLANLNPDGSVDTSFAPNPDYEVRAIAQQTDGKLVVGGLFSNIGGGTQHMLGRLNVNGTQDVSFLRKVNDRGQFTSLASANTGSPVNGVPAIAYYDVAQSDLRYVRAVDVNGNDWVPSRRLDGAGGLNVGEGTSMKIANIGGDIIVENPTNGTATITTLSNLGNPAIAYYDQQNGNLKYILSYDSAGDAWSTPEILENIGTGGGHLSLEIVNGFPGIAYYKNTNNPPTAPRGLYYIHATHVGGLTSNFGAGVTQPIVGVSFESAFGAPQLLDSGNAASPGQDIVGQYPSLTVVNGQPTTAAGTPAVAYYDATRKDLKYVRANTASGMPTGSWGQPIIVVNSANDVGRYTSMIMTDGVPGISYQDFNEELDERRLKFVHLTDASGYSKLTFTGDTTLSGGMNLDGMAIVSPENGSTVTVTGALTGSGGFRLNTDGTLVINSSNNNFGGGLGEQDNGSARVVIRTGNLLLGSSTALGINTSGINNPAWHGRVDLGDRNGNPFLTNPQVSVLRATSGTSVLAGGGSFDAGLGAGTFVNVANVVDGFTFTTSDINSLVLVKDELAHPERNGVYLVSIPNGQPAGTMNLVRAPALDALNEFVYGTKVGVQTGSKANEIYFLASLVKTVNTSPVLWAQTLTVDRATTGFSLTRDKGRFDATHNGLFSNAGGPGAFVEIDTTIDGRTFTEADVGTLILVKDELENPAWNGVYQVIYSAGLQLDGTMNLVRAPELDQLAELTYGTQARVTNGTHAGEAYFIASQVSDLNNSPVLWTRDVADGDLSLRTAVSGLTISQAIDVNARQGAGSMSLGSATSMTTGNATFTGDITLRDNQAQIAEIQKLNLDSNILSGYGVSINGNITEARGTAGLDSNNNPLPADSLSLVKTGTGVVTLRGNNSTFHGGVSVNEGTLLVMNTNVTTGSATGSGTVRVNAGAVLGGIGRIGGPVELVGTGTGIETRATLRIGDPTVTSPEEKLTLGGPLTVGANSVVEFTLGANNLTKLAGTSVNITETGRLLVQLAAGYNPAINTSFDILDLTGSLTFGPGNLSDYVRLPGQYLWDTSTLLSQGVIRITGLTDDVEITAQPVAIAVNPGLGTIANFSVTVAGSPQFVYQWQRSINGGAFENIGDPVRSSQLTNTFSKTGIFEADQGLYRVVVTNGEGAFTATSNPVLLTVNDPPVIAVQPLPQSANPNGSVSFTVQLDLINGGPPPYAFQWRRGTTNINSGGRFSVTSDAQTGFSTLTITGLLESDEDSNYNVVPSNLAGNGPVSNLVSLTVNNPVVITSPPTSVQVSTGDIAFFRVIATGTPTLTYQWQRREAGGVFANIPGETASTLRIAGITNNDNGDEVRVEVTNSVGTVPSAVASISVVEGVPNIQLQPESYTLVQGENLELITRVGGAQTGRTVVWKRNKGAIKLGDTVVGGVTSKISVTEELDGTVLVSTLRIENITPALAGEFTVEAKNVNVTKPTLSVPGTGQVVVASNPDVNLPASNKPKTKATMTVLAMGPKGVTIGYKWKRLVNSVFVDIPAEDLLDFTGVTTKTLTINNVEVADRGTYACEITGVGDPAVRMAGTHHLKVYTEGADLEEIEFPFAMVGSDFEYQIPVDFGVDGSKTPVSYAAAGLPAGLKLDAKTGKITGRPTKAGAFAVKVSAINALGTSKTDPINPVLTVQAIPEGAVGVFAGWIPRDELNGELGGRFDMTVTALGTFSGRVTLGGNIHAFKGILDIDLDPDTGVPQSPNATITIARTGKPVPPPLTLTFALNPDQNRLASASLSTTVQQEVDGQIEFVDLEVAFTGWRNKWSKNLPANPYLNELAVSDSPVEKPPVSGYYTFALMPPDASADTIPQGDSYASFTVNALGGLSMVGRTADGQTITGAQFVGPNGEIVMYQALYKAPLRGSLVGQITLNKVDDGKYADNIISASPGTAPTWSCPPNPKATSYLAGFGPITLTVTGGAYEDPTRKPVHSDDVGPFPLILGIARTLVEADNKDNATLLFSQDGIEGIGPLMTPNLPYPGSTDKVDVTAKNTVVVPKQISGGINVNPYGTTLTVTAKTGAIRGTVMVQQLLLGKLVKRTAAYQGLIVRTDEGLRGVGYYLMVKRSNEKVPLISNQVLFSPAP